MGRNYHGRHGRGHRHHGGGGYRPAGPNIGEMLINNIIASGVMMGMTRLFDCFDKCVDRSISTMQPQQVVYTTPPPQMMQPMQPIPPMQQAPMVAYQMDIYGNIYDANGNLVGNANRQQALTTR